MPNVTLNLIPARDKQELRLVNLFLAIKNLVSLALIGMIALAAGLIAAKGFLQSYFNHLVASNTLTREAGRYANNDLRTFRTELAAVQQVQQEYIPFSELLLQLGAHIPPGVTLTDFSVDKTGAAELSGIAARRDDLLALHDRLVRSGFADEFIIPLTTKFQEDNIKFRLSLKLRVPRIIITEHVD
ncbi:MAG: hypothetical protein G01um101431_344 [Parcubacteria group bacterium Gr01-1014_31]|nr:MAG: hypothetical protein G01um101431_344 [Parcubacteria group bacterium Gr01-1014_31]